MMHNSCKAVGNDAQTIDRVKLHNNDNVPARPMWTDKLPAQVNGSGIR